MKIIVVNRRIEWGDVYIGRPSRWGNPFRVIPAGGRSGLWTLRDASGACDDHAQSREGAHTEAVALYRKWIKTRSDLVRALQSAIERVPRVMNAAGEYRPPEVVKLSCWCSPLPCHGDVLAELVRERMGAVDGR